jgi:putative DNA primase/helicase
MTKPPLLSATTPHKTALLFCSQERPTLRRYQNDWYAWDPRTGVYVLIENATIMSELGTCMTKAERVVMVEGKDGKRKQARAPFNPTPSQVEAAYKMLVQQRHRSLQDMPEAPAWLDGRTSPDPKDVIVCRNGIVNMKTRRVIPLTPELFTLSALGCDYNPKAPVPRKWLRFLWQATKRRKEIVTLLQELMGYGIQADRSIHVIAFLLGRSRSGKSTILGVLDALVGGAANVQNSSLSDLGSRFGLQNCINKLLIIMRDLDVDYAGEGRSTAAMRMNQISGRDPVGIQRKGIGDWNGLLPGMLWLGGNGMPNFGASTLAMSARLRILPFDESFLGREDWELPAKLRTELSGILNWCLDGLDSLRDRGRFLEPEVCIDAKTRLLNRANPIHGFGQTKCVIDMDAQIEKDHLYQMLKEFCRNNETRCPTYQEFTERVLETFPTVSPSRRNDGERATTYRGIRLNDVQMCKLYKTDTKITDIFGGADIAAVKLDKQGWPILRNEFDN